MALNIKCVWAQCSVGRGWGWGEGDWIKAIPPSCLWQQGRVVKGWEGILDSFYLFKY